MTQSKIKVFLEAVFGIEVTRGPWRMEGSQKEVFGCDTMAGGICVFLTKDINKLAEPRILEQLQDEEVGVPKIIKTRSGQSIAPLEDYFGWVTERWEGEILSRRTMTPDQCEELGYSLSCLHKAGDRKALSNLPQWSWRENVSRFQKLVEVMCELQGMAISEVKSELNVLEDTGESCGFIHGDLHTENIIQMTEGRFGFLDLGKAAFGPRDYDRVVLEISLGNGRSISTDQSREALRQGYARFRQKGDRISNNKAVLEIAWKLETVASTWEYLETMAVGAGDQYISRLENRIATLEFLNRRSRSN